MEYSKFEQATYEAIAKVMGVTPEAVRDDFLKFSEEIYKLIKEGYTEEEAEMTVASSWVPSYL